MKDEKYWEDLGRRAVACEGWRPMCGMLGIRDAKRLRADLAFDGDKTRVSHTYEGGVLFSALGFVPDLRDPATVGCLLALVREKHGLAVSSPRERDLSSSWNVIRWDLNVLGHGNTESEALVAALEQVER